MTFATFIGDSGSGIIGIINTIVIPVIFALIFATFLYGIAKYFLWSGDDEKARTSGRALALWGVLAIVALLSVWGIVNALLSTLGIG